MSENGQTIHGEISRLARMTTKSAPSFRVRPLPHNLAENMRSAMEDERGHRIKTLRDEERHQCRVCLQLTEPGDPYLLGSYTPFERDSAYAETGPIFIHQKSCRPWDSEGGYPNEFPRNDVVLRAYNEAGSIQDAEWVGDREVEDVIEEILDNPRVDFIHARNSTYGCFMFRVDRRDAAVEEKMSQNLAECDRDS